MARRPFHPGFISLSSDLRDQLQTTLGVSYAITRELGGGGMSRVFVATEAALQRQVVVKVLPPELAGGVNIDRFRREITIVAQLQHPHIVPVLAAGDSAGLPYFTMPYVEGQSLRARLSHGELPLADVIWILRDVAKALSYAHKHSVVHRDIKPDNVLLNEGSAVVTDFGVAKALSESASTGTLTSLGVALGTPAYMSPEQAVASSSIDARSDIYAFGVMAYEMIAGHTPFAGRSLQQMLAAHSVETPVPIETQRPAVAPGLARLVTRCLEKRPADRPQSADELLQELNAIGTPSGGTAPHIPTTAGAALGKGRLPQWAVAALLLLVVGAVGYETWRRQKPTLNPRRVAVAPFENSTGDPALDPVGRIASDWITHGISQLDSVDVVSSAAALEATSGPGDKVRLLAERAKVGTVIWGTYYKQGDSLRIQAQVTDARTGRVIRSIEPVMSGMSDPLPAITRIRERLLTEIAMGDSRRIVMTTPPVYAAYREYAHGVQSFMGQRDWRTAAGHFERALALDSTFMMAYAYLSATYNNLGRTAASDSISRAAQRFRRTAVGPDLETIDWLDASLRRDELAGLIIQRRWAARDSTPLALYLVGFHAIRLNRPNETIQALGRVDRVGQTNGWISHWIVLASGYHYIGDHKGELDAVRRGREIYRASDELATWEIRALAGLGDVAGIRRIVDSVRQSQVDTSYTATNSARIAASELRAHGHPAAAREFVEQALSWFQQRTRAGEVPMSRGRRLLYASTHYELGQLDSAQRIASAVLAEDTASVNARGGVGLIAARKGDTTAARAALAWLDGVKNPYPDANPRMMRARIFAALGDRAGAVSALQTSLARLDPFVLGFHTMAEVEALRDYAPFKELLKPKG